MRRFAWLLAVLALAATACGTTKDTGFSPTPTPTETEGGAVQDDSTLENPTEYTEGEQVAVIDNNYAPRFIKAAAGTTVLWHQTGSAPHNVVADDDSFNSNPNCKSDIGSCMGEGDEFSFTFAEPGEYPYYCQIHGTPGDPEAPGNMAGVVIIE